MSKRKLDVGNILVAVLLAVTLGFTVMVGYYVVPEMIENSSERVTKVIQVVDVKRPTYEYLKSVTLYMVHPDGPLTDPKTRAGRATGTIIAEKDGMSYVLTNHHVCEADADNCYVSLTGEGLPKGLIKLTFVKSADYDNGIDLELWKVETERLEGKSVVKGFRSSSIAERVYSVGNYLGIPYLYTEGTKSGRDEDGEIYNLPCTFGCSGSGIFNADGELVAVLYAGKGIPTTIPIIESFDTAKAIAIDSFDVKAFLKGIINE